MHDLDTQWTELYYPTPQTNSGVNLWAVGAIATLVALGFTLKKLG